MERRHTQALQAHGWQVIASGAALGAALLMATTPALHNPSTTRQFRNLLQSYTTETVRQSAGAITEDPARFVATQPARVVTRCVLEGTTTYSDTDCAGGTSIRQVRLDDEPPAR